ncbi:MAG: S-layer homology domain-containing protein [Candidatus Ornithomonoglobus sp.]
MNRYIKIISAFMAVLLLYGTNAYAKSFSLINGNMDYRKSLIFEPEFKIYVKTGPDNYPYYGAKFEPRAGIYIGTPYNKTYPGIDNAINTQYEWFVPGENIKNENCPRNPIAEKTSSHTVLKGINLNFSLKNSQVIDVREYSNYLYNKIDKYASWGEDIMLIFGKEMNIDNNFNDPELFKDCFRFVADYAHTKENIAMVWAPNDMGGLDTTFEEFYPGDEYVDWIGCSLYTMPYFQGNPNVDDSANMLFLMSDYANPSMHAKMIHQFMIEHNIQKPVMITEGGVGYESPGGIDYTEWAKPQIRMYYADICRIYPEFKCIVSFDEYVPEGDLYRYDISRNPQLLALMQEVTSDPIYLKTYPSSAGYSFMDMFNNMIFTDKIEVSAYAYIPKKQNLVVRYLIDGKWISEKSEPPYAISLDNSYVSYGTHTLTCEIYDGEIIRNPISYKFSFIPSDTNYTYADTSDNGSCPFIDMSSQPAEMKNAVAFLADKGILNGLDGVNFGADRKISRSELAAMLMRLMGEEESNIPCGLTDVSEDDWYYGIINAAVNNGLITGYEDGAFHGARAINRNEFITMAAKIIKNRTGAAVPDIELPYTDTLADWAKDHIKTAKANNIILERPDGIFYGDGYVSRGDAAVMIKRLYDVIN